MSNIEDRFVRQGIGTVFFSLKIIKHENQSELQAPRNGRRNHHRESGHTGADLTRIISLNKSARRLYEQLSDKEFTLEDTAKVLTDTYGIDGQQALKDATVWVEALKNAR